MAEPEHRTHLCPICEQPNACTMAATGDSSIPCWCREVKVPRRLVSRLPLEERNARCICAKCIESFRRAPTIPDTTPQKP